MRLVSQRTVDVSVSIHSVTTVVEEIPKVVIIERIEQLPLPLRQGRGLVLKKLSSQLNAIRQIVTNSTSLGSAPTVSC